MEVRCLFFPNKTCPSNCPCHEDAKAQQNAKSNNLKISNEALVHQYTVYSPINPAETTDLSPLNNISESQLCLNLNRIQ